MNCGLEKPPILQKSVLFQAFVHFSFFVARQLLASKKSLFDALDLQGGQCRPPEWEQNQHGIGHGGRRRGAGNVWNR